MGVMIDGEWHEELADPCAGSYASPGAYNAASAGTQWGQNLNTTYGSGNPGSNQSNTGANQYGSAIQSALNALASGNREAFQRAIYEWDKTFEFDKEKFADDVRRFNANFAVSEAGLTGTYSPTRFTPGSYLRDPGTEAVYAVGPNGMLTWVTDAAQIPPGTTPQVMPGLTASLGGLREGPTQLGQATLPALTSYATQFGQWGTPTPGQQTLAAQNQYFNQGLEGIKAAAAMQANPFRQQQVLGQLGGLYGGQGVAGFQAPNVVPGVGTVGQQGAGMETAQDMVTLPNGQTVPRNVAVGAGWQPQGRPRTGGTGMGYLQQMIDDIHDPTANQTSMSQILDATPTPNKLNSVDFLRAAPSTQNMVLQAMQEKYGLDPEDSVKQIKNTLPSFQAPSAMGGIRR